MWKVYHIQSGRLVKAGFDSDDQAKDWLERRKDLAEDEHDIDEMDEEEEEEFLESEGDDDDEGGDYVAEDAEAEDVRDISYPDDDVGAGDDDEDESDDEDDDDDDDDRDEDEEESEEDDY